MSVFHAWKTVYLRHLSRLGLCDGTDEAGGEKEDFSFWMWCKRQIIKKNMWKKHKSICRAIWRHPALLDQRGTRLSESMQQWCQASWRSCSFRATAELPWVPEGNQGSYEHVCVSVCEWERTRERPWWVIMYTAHPAFGWPPLHARPNSVFAQIQWPRVTSTIKLLRCLHA